MRIRIILMSLMCLVSVQWIAAKHIVGGEVTYECTQTDGYVGGYANYNIRFIIYRDVLGVTEFDDPASFGIFRQIDINDWMSVDSVIVNFENRSLIELTKDPCVIPPGNVIVDKAEYNFSVRLRILQNERYLVAYQRCCRNNTINNVIRPDLTGAAFKVEISPQAQITGNASPRFRDFPPPVVCVGFDLLFDHSAFDREGDSLIYEFFNPFHAGGLRGSAPSEPGSPWACDGVTPSAIRCLPPFDEIKFANPYYYAAPMGGAPLVSIDRFTGIISGKPNVLGQFAVGVKVKEYRNGIQIGTIYRDFQFNVTPCEPKIFAEIESDEQIGFKKYVINSCGQDTVNFINISQDRNYIFDNFWVFNINGLKDTIHSWDATEVFPGIGNYQGKLLLNPGTQCPDSADIYLNIYPDIKADFNFEYDTCLAGPVVFTDESFTGSGEMKKWIWAFEPEKKSFIANPSYFFNTPGDKWVQLAVEDINSCLDTSTQKIPYFPAPALIVVEPSQFTGCAPAGLKFKNLSIPIDSSYTTIWDFGDGGFSDELHPYHIFDEPGVYTLSLKVISPIGCEIERTFPGWIKIKESPIADFYYEPENPGINNPIVDFIDLSERAISWQWNFGDGTVNFEQFPTHSFPDSGLYKIQLVVAHENNCTDTLIQYIDIEPIVTYFMPNAFTPNGDGYNDNFRGKGLFTSAMRSFSLSIWSRWGNMLFESNDPLLGWNGRKNNVGELLPQGVYVYQLKYTDARGLTFNKKGFVSLIR